MILVTGATGTNGTEVVRRLSAAGANVRALARDPHKKVDGLDAPGVEVVKGDLADPASLVAAMTGVEAVFLLCPVDSRQEQLEANAVEAARSAGVKRLVKFSVIHASADSPSALLRAHHAAETRVRESGIPFTFLRPNMFMQEILRQAGTIRSQGAFFLPMGKTKVSLVDVRDIADVAARVLLEPGLHEGKTYEITGPEALGFDEVAARLTKAVGRPISYVPVTMEQFHESFTGMGAPAWMADMIRDLYLTFEGRNDQVKPGVAQVMSHAPRSFDDFARDHAPALS